MFPGADPDSCYEPVTYVSLMPYSQHQEQRVKSMSHVRTYKDVCIGILPQLLALRLRDEIRGSTALFLFVDVLAWHPFL